MTENKLSPLMAEYRNLREQISENTILIVRIGDFYEMFFDEAKIGKEVLGLSLTQRNGVLMSGFPYHKYEFSVGKLRAAGYEVALAEYNPETKKREIVRHDN